MKGDQGGEYDSFLSYKKVPENLKFIKEYGVERYLELQKTRIDLLETILESFNDSRSRSFYCIASTLLPTADIEAALEEAKRKIKDDNIPSEDQKSKAKILKMLLNKIASKHGTELKLRKKK